MTADKSPQKPADKNSANDKSWVFRKVSLDRLASPEQLDQLLPVTDTGGWVTLGGVGVLLAAALVWGVAGTVPENVSGTGILVKSGGVFDVSPVAAGLVTDVAVSVGEMVTEGQVVGRMAQPEAAARLQQAKATLAELREHHRQLETFGDNNMALQAENLARQREAVEQAIESARKIASWTAGKIRIQIDLVARGLLLKQTLLENREKQHQAMQQIGRGKSELAQIAVKELELRNQRDEQLEASRNKIAETQRTVEQATRELETKTRVVSPYTGRILEVLAEQGSLLAAGEPLLRLDLSGRTIKRLEAVLFVPSVNGKQIQVGMPVLIAPATVKKEEFGLMVAKVMSVSDFPVTVKAMQRVLKNEKLVEALAGSDAPYEVHADLVIDPSTPSRYRWSSSKGPPEEIRSGTLASASIAVSYRRPIELLLPMIRKRNTGRGVP